MNRTNIDLHNVSDIRTNKPKSTGILAPHVEIEITHPDGNTVTIQIHFNDEVISGAEKANYAFRALGAKDSSHAG